MQVKGWTFLSNMDLFMTSAQHFIVLCPQSTESFGCLNGFASHGSISQTYLKKIGFGIL